MLQLIGIIEKPLASHLGEIHTASTPIKHLKGTCWSFGRRALDKDEQLLLENALHDGEAGIVASAAAVCDVQLHTARPAAPVASAGAHSSFVLLDATVSTPFPRLFSS
jgi:hypothetical protein